MFLDKNKVAAIVVACDLFAVVLAFGMIFYLKKNQEIVLAELDTNELTASDFTIEIRNLPPPKNNQSLLDYKIEMFEWIENFCDKKAEKFLSPETN